MPFGLTNAPMTFIDRRNRVLRPHLNKFIVVLIDDILVYSKDREEQTTHLKTVLQALREHQLQDKLKKYEFWLDEVVFLGYVFSKEGIMVDHQMVNIITE